LGVNFLFGGERRSLTNYRFFILEDFDVKVQIWIDKWDQIHFQQDQVNKHIDFGLGFACASQDTYVRFSGEFPGTEVADAQRSSGNRETLPEKMGLMIPHTPGHFKVHGPNCTVNLINEQMASVPAEWTLLFEAESDEWGEMHAIMHTKLSPYGLYLCIIWSDLATWDAPRMTKTGVIDAIVVSRGYISVKSPLENREAQRAFVAVDINNVMMRIDPQGGAIIIRENESVEESSST
jgi:hypothetical protein